MDADKLKTVPVDLAKLNNVVKNEVVKKTDYSTKITSIVSQIASLTKNTVDNLADITKFKAVDTNNFVLKTKLASDVTTLENKIDTVDKKIPDINGLATKTSLNDYLQTSTFNSKVTEVENKIKANDTKANTIRSDLTGYAKKADVGTDINLIKNNYVTNANLTSQLNNLKSQHIADEAKKVGDKVNENKKEITFIRGFYSYEHNSNLVYDCKLNSFKFYVSGYILDWKLKNIYDPSNKNKLHSTQNINNFYPRIKNISGELYVSFSGNYFVQNIVNISNNVINIYCVYKLDPVDFSRNNKFTIQKALFGAIEITKNANTSKYKYKGYGICFDESDELLTYEKKIILIILLWLEK